MKKSMSLFMVLCMVLTLCACGKSTGIKESQILSDIPEQFITVDGQTLNYDSIEVSKRNTEEGVDNIYFTLAASNSDYEVTAQCHFQYNYYSEGGWILDYAEMVNGEYTVTPLNGYSSDSAEEYMQNYYMDYQLVSSDFGLDGDSYYTKYVYEGTNEWTYYSQTVSEDFLYIFETGLDVWEDSENIYCNNIMTDWVWNGGSEITSEHWALDLDMYAETSYHKVRLSIAPDGEAATSLQYDGYFWNSAVFLGPDEYVGNGTADYEINYDDLNDPYVSSQATLCYVSHGTVYDYETETLLVRIEKDSVYINAKGSWIEVEDVS